MRILFASIALLGVLWSCKPEPAPAATTTTQPTRKLCLPTDTIVSYSSPCPAGTTSVMKICPYGQQVLYSATCPKTASVLTYKGKSSAQLACQSQPYSPSYTTVVGTIYVVEGFAHYMATVPDSLSTARDVVVLSDGVTHRGDGAFAIWVPVNCVVAL